MFESFLFPYSMIAGGVLISAPIIIHLINRMRFKRIRWAAMEFLLKSQKRNQRRLIIEQLILLLLRITLVVLAGFILARFLGCTDPRNQPHAAQHLILLDDTLSMNDQWLEQGDTKTSFKEAKRLVVEEIAKNAAKAGRAQHLKLVCLSQPEQVRFDQRLNDQSVRELTSVLGTIDGTALHVGLLPGIKRARQVLETTPQDQRILYILSDFRHTDWSGPGGVALNQELQEMSEHGVHVKFVDGADPPRKESEKEPRFHANLAIVELRPEAKVTVRNRLTEFSAAVKNYGPTERKNVQLKVKVNGQERAESDVPLATVKPNEKEQAKIHVYLDQLGINQVSVSIEAEDTGLVEDNSRYTVVEVRERLPILLVDGDAINSRKEGGDTFFLQMLFNANRGVIPGYDLISGAPGDLERPGLERYPSVYLVNVRELSDKALANLEAYVRDGGNVAFFMGDRVSPDYYNRKLYRDGAGIFPVPLATRPTPVLTDEERDRRKQDRQFQLLVRDLDHPLFALFKQNPSYLLPFMDVNLDRHYPVPRVRWKPTPGQTEELMTLPNRQSVDDYKDTVQDLLNRLPLDQRKYDPYRGRLNYYRDAIRDNLANRPLHRLARTIDEMLYDRGNPDNPELPNLVEFWALPEMAELRTAFENMYERVQYGDPLLVMGKFGKGRSAVYLTSIGKNWNNALAGSEAMPNFLILMYELQKYLTSSVSDDSLTVGSPVEITLDATRYEDKVRRLYQSAGREQPAAAAAPGEVPGQPGQVDMGEQRAAASAGGKLLFRFADAFKPGVYVLEFTPRGEDGTEQKREQRGYAFNVDTAAESNLLRAPRGELLEKVKNAQFYTLGSDQFTALQQRISDESEKLWPYLLFLLVLLCEQALAVRLSFHVPAGAPPPEAARVEVG